MHRKYSVLPSWCRRGSACCAIWFSFLARSRPQKFASAAYSSVLTSVPGLGLLVRCCLASRFLGLASCLRRAVCGVIFKPSNQSTTITIVIGFIQSELKKNSYVLFPNWQAAGRRQNQTAPKEGQHGKGRKSARSPPMAGEKGAVPFSRL